MNTEKEIERLKEQLKQLIMHHSQATEHRLNEFQAKQTQAVDELKERIKTTYDETEITNTLESVAAALDEESQKEKTSAFSDLRGSIYRIRNQTTQANILLALAEAASSFADRVIVFVSRGENVVAWQTRGFSNGIPNEQAVSVPKNADTILKAAAERCASVEGNVSSYSDNSAFLASLGNVDPKKILAIPLVINKTSPAVLYADSGGKQERVINKDALEILAQVSSLTIENLALSLVQEKVPVSKEMAPALERKTPARESTYQPTPPVPPSVVVTPEIKKDEPPEVKKVPGEEEKLHFDAKRCARLAVTEIKLYNEDKVREGRRGKDLYAKLKQEIDRGREWYEKRVPVSVRGKADYYHDELVRILGENDITTLGNEYPGPKLETN